MYFSSHKVKLLYTNSMLFAYIAYGIIWWFSLGALLFRVGKAIGIIKYSQDLWRPVKQLLFFISGFVTLFCKENIEGPINIIIGLSLLTAVIIHYRTIE